MNKKSIFYLLLLFIFINLSACSIKPPPSIVSHHAEALLTNKNELQFRFKINERVFTDEKMYKVKVQIHHDELAAALGSDEIVYGSQEVFDGKTLNVNDKDSSFIYMRPIPLLLDLHVFEIEKMIREENAISIEIISDEEVIAETYLTNFTSQI